MRSEGGAEAQYQHAEEQMPGSAYSAGYLW